MAKKNNTMIIVLIGLAVLVVGYLLMNNNKARTTGNGNGNGGSTPFNALPTGCYPFEEVHETGGGLMWLSIIPYLADGVTSARPPHNATSIGNQVEITNTGSALDGVYTIHDIYYNPNTNNIGSFLVDIPSGYNFNYNATQGGQPRDMTYFGIGHICLI